MINPHPYGPIAKSVLKSLVKEGLSRGEIAEKLGCTLGKVHCYLHRYNLRINTRGNRLIDLVGQSFGRLVVTKYKGYYAKNKLGRKRTWWLCKCECGKKKIISTDTLKQGNAVSCGCYNQEQRSQRGGQSKKYLNNWYYIQDEEKHFCRSSYEVFYINHLLRNGIPFIYEPEVFRLSDTERYTPDFLINKDEYIEIKGSFHQYPEQLNKILKFKKTHKLKILYWKDLVKLCGLPYKGWKDIVNKASKFDMTRQQFLAEGLYYNYKRRAA